jgi:Mrp family chromosome partitioning ATPase
MKPASVKTPVTPPATRLPGRVITFYSYKGGTGRSMALSNIAWILASAGKRVLMIDWDLEAPGLHRYFRPFLIDHELGASDGLMDLIDRYASEAIRPPPEGDSLAPDWWWPLSDISEHVLGIAFDGFAAGGAIDLLPAGRQCATYAVKVSAFNWQNFFDRLGGGGFLDAVRQRAKADYDYVLIDSRTGVSDTSGICTAQMPDTLVVCFTYNNQSIKGAAAVAASARQLQAEVVEERRHAALATDLATNVSANVSANVVANVPANLASHVAVVPTIADTPQPLRIYPVPMRVDAGESERLLLRQSFAREAFASLMNHHIIPDVMAYWAKVEVPHRVFYAYEEVLAPFKDDARDPSTVLAAFVRITHEISGGEVSDYLLPIAPELRQQLLEAYAQTPQSQTSRQASEAATRESADDKLARRIESSLLALTEEEREQARSVLGRLVRVGRDDEGGGVFPIRVALSEFDEHDHAMIATLSKSAVLTVTSEKRTAANGQSVADQVVQPAHERMFSVSPTLQKWLTQDREFLLWRQHLRAYRSDWEKTGEASTLLAGSPLSETRVWSRKRPQDLNQREVAYIGASIQATQAQQAAPAAPAAAAAPAAPGAWAQAAAPTLPPNRESLIDTRRWATGLGALLLLLGAGGVAYLYQPQVTTPPQIASHPPAPPLPSSAPASATVPASAATPAATSAATPAAADVGTSSASSVAKKNPQKAAQKMAQ